MMELVTASDLFVTASVAILLSFLVAKLVSLAMTDTHSTTKHHANDEPVGPVLLGEKLTVQTAQSESRVEFISPVQVATYVETEHDTVESDSNVVVVSPVKSDPDISVKEKVAEPDEGTQEFDGSSEQRNAKSVDEISVEPSIDTEVSVVESGMKESDNDDDDDDDWEGIERSELEKVFMAATEFVGEENGLESVGSNVQMELYGLHKVATEGPCHEPQPMPLKLSARAKWNAWQKLGNMSPEVAMEQYISILSDKVPGWMDDSSTGMSEHEPTRSEVSDSAAPELTTSLSHQQMIITERKLEQESDSQGGSQLEESDLENEVKK